VAAAAAVHAMPASRFFMVITFHSGDGKNAYVTGA
jgi:hypothetical protein